MLSRKAFTLIEITIVVIILGILASFGLPGFTKTINKAKARDAMNNMRIIHAMNSVYFARNGVNITAANLSAINDPTTGLGLNIVGNGSTYSCNGVTCTATGAGSMFTVTLTLGAANPLSDVPTYNPSCAPASACP
jgi:prepilin-type N-terminal cleavage/methylation domain-containing protein